MASSKKKKSITFKHSYQELVENISDWIWELNTKGIFTYVSPQCYKLLGYKPNELIGKTPFMFMSKSEAKKITKAFHSISKTQKSFTRLEVKHLHKNGETIIFETSGTPIFNKQEKFCGYQGLNHNITNYKKNENQLKKYKTQLEDLVQERTKKIEKTNIKLRKEIIDRKKTEKKLQKVIEEFKNTQLQLVQSEKMAGVGQLAAGIAHEINNPTGFIINNFLVLEKYTNNLFKMIKSYERIINLLVKDDPNQKEKISIKINKLKEEITYQYMHNDLPNLLSESKDGAERIKKIVNNLKNFAHPSTDEMQPCSINDEIDTALTLVWNDLKFICKVNKKYNELPKIYCKSGEIVQVIVNLLINASQAIENKDGLIEIETYIDTNDICITVSDNGKGIPKSELNKIFEPFYTTKGVGKGTGLGLSIAYGIIKNHKGTIKVESKVGQGTTFIIKLPIKVSK